MLIASLYSRCLKNSSTNSAAIRELFCEQTAQPCLANEIGINQHFDHLFGLAQIESYKALETEIVTEFDMGVEFLNQTKRSNAHAT